MTERAKPDSRHKIQETDFLAPQDSSRVRQATVEDVTGVVACHLESFPGFFLSFLGPRFLAEFYRGLVTGPAGILLVAEQGGGVAGFVGGAFDEKLFFQDLLTTRRRAFIREAAIVAVQHPSAIPRLWRARRRSDVASSSAATATLLTLGVSPEHRRAGVGAQLVTAFGTVLAEAGVGAFCLTTDERDNEPAHAFYRSLGMTPASTRVTAEGRRMTEYLCRVTELEDLP